MGGLKDHGVESAGPDRPVLDPEQWLAQHGDALYRLARYRTGHEDVAEDLVQETLLAAWTARAGFQARASERAWLVGILKHKIDDYFRRRPQTARARPEEDAGSEEVQFFDEAGEWRHSFASDGQPPSGIEEPALWRTFSECVQALPEPLQEAFALSDLTDMPVAGICDTLSVSPNHLYVLLHRARLRLRLCLEAAWFCSK